MICMPKPKVAPRTGGITLLVLSALSVLAGLHYHQYSFLITSGSYGGVLCLLSGLIPGDLITLAIGIGIHFLAEKLGNK